MNEGLSFTVACWHKCPVTVLESGGQMGDELYQSSLSPFQFRYSVFRWVPSLLWASVPSSWKRENCAHLRLVRLQSDCSWGTINSLAYWCFQRGPSSHPGTLWGGSLVRGFAQLDSNQQTFAYCTVVYLLIWIYAIIFFRETLTS